jgi:serine/threonine protein kinase
MDKFVIIRQLGGGTFATVNLAKNKETGEMVAIKYMRKKFTTWEECTQL